MNYRKSVQRARRYLSWVWGNVFTLRTQLLCVIWALNDDEKQHNEGKIGLCSLPVLYKVKTRQLLVRMLSPSPSKYTFMQSGINVEEHVLMLVIFRLQCPNLMSRR